MLKRSRIDNMSWWTSVPPPQSAKNEINDVVWVNGQTMKVVDFIAGKAVCVFVDGDGRIHRKVFSSDRLPRMTERLQIRPTWPTAGQFDLVDIELEERAAAAARRAERKKAAKNSKRSNKIKRSAGR